jgi:hypothetical protein
MNLFRTATLLAALCIAAGVPVGFSSAQTNSSPQPATLDTSAIGKVMTADGTARIEHAANVVVQANLPAGDVGQAKAGDLVYRGDLISTGADGKLSISFADGTAFNVSSNARNVSSNARMEVNEFVYDPKGHANSSLMSLSKGTFTFIAGNVAHTGDMKVDTPLGTMGIRGTAPRVEILEDGTVKFSTLVEEK